MPQDVLKKAAGRLTPPSPGEVRVPFGTTDAGWGMQGLQRMMSKDRAGHREGPEEEQQAEEEPAEEAGEAAEAGAVVQVGPEQVAGVRGRDGR